MLDLEGIQSSNESTLAAFDAAAEKPKVKPKPVQQPIPKELVEIDRQNHPPGQTDRGTGTRRY